MYNFLQHAGFDSGSEINAEAVSGYENNTGNVGSTNLNA